MLRSNVEIKGPVRATVWRIMRLIPLAIVCVLFGALLADLLMRGETGAGMVASAVCAGLGWVVREKLDEVTR